jgi:copper(I)-binding protein
MRKIILAAAFAAILPVAGPVAGPALSAEYTAGTITVTEPWTRAMPPGAKVGGGFMVITNSGDTADRLLEVKSPRADHGEVHEMAMDNGVMKMRELADGLEIPAGGSVELKPGGYHVMLMGVSEGFEEGETIPAVLVFETAGEVEIAFPAAPVGAKSMQPMPGHSSSQTN